MTLITLIIESFLSSEQITLTLSVQRPYLLTYSYDIVLLYCLGCIYTIPTCQTLITLITLIIESFLSYEQITLTLSVQRPYLLTYSYDVVLLYSLGCIHPIPTCQTLITPITLIIESFLSYEQITLTLSVHRPYLLTYSYDVVLLYSLGCIHPISTCQTLITLITLITEPFVTICTDNVNGPLAALTWNPPLPVSGGYFLAVRAHFHWIKVGQEGRQEDNQEGYFHDRYLGNAIIYPQTLS